MRYVFSKYGVLLSLLFLCLIIGLINPVFFSIGNLVNVIVQASVIAVIAAGMTFVIIGSGIDLSVGSIVAFSGVILGWALQNSYSVYFAVGLCLSLGILSGITNGALIAYGKLPPFIATLGLMGILRGLALLYTGGRSISGFEDSFLFLANGNILGLPSPIIILITVYALSFVILKFTYIGKYVYAIGGNREAAWLSGIRVNYYTLLTYLFSGVTSSIAAIMLTARLNSAQPIAGMMYELDAIAAAVIGGTSLMGGTGSIIGTLIGALIISVIKNGLNILNVSAYIQQLVIGLAIILAVFLDRVGKQK